MDTADLVEWRTRSTVGGLIRLRTGLDVNHTSVVIRLDQYFQKRLFILEAVEWGVALAPLSERLRRFNGNARWLRLRPEWAVYRREIGKHALAFAGIPYDYGSLFRQLLGHVSANARRLFCSELAFIAMKRAQVPPAAARIKVPWPGEFEKIGTHVAGAEIL